jgi:NAD/NADP transhydrogenase beta subunit
MSLCYYFITYGFVVTYANHPLKEVAMVLQVHFINESTNTKYLIHPLDYRAPAPAPWKHETNTP